jgi:L-methionine (R)-S-oxide reductase
LRELAAHCLAKGVDVARSRAALRSRSTQIGYRRDQAAPWGKASKMIVEHPDKLARLLARTFYREMSRAGFECNQIIQLPAELFRS